MFEEEGLSNILTNENREINVLTRVALYMSLPKKKILMKSFFTSQFSYCQLFCLSHSHTINNKINSLHKRCLRTIRHRPLNNFQEKIGQSQYTKAVRSFQQRCSKFTGIFHILSSYKLSIDKFCPAFSSIFKKGMLLLVGLCLSFFKILFQTVFYDIYPGHIKRHMTNLLSREK